nr:DUF4062 domain-containing protein [uncultured Flavobacterium sp.]
MKRKLQIFISSTFSDMIEERQAAVEAVLRAGHIPAGMELFSAGNESQLEIIKRWIDDSDIYMLLLGGRYGTLDSESGLSYTEIEYKYAIEKGKPFFAVVISDSSLDQKVNTQGKSVLELKEPKKYEDFKSLVLSKISRFSNSNNEIKFVVLESIMDIQNRFSLSGWVKASEVPDTTLVLKQITELTAENRKLEQQNKLTENSTTDKIGDYNYDDLKEALQKITVTIPADLLNDYIDGEEVSVLDLFIKYKNFFSVGINNRANSSRAEIFLITEVMSHLRIYELAEIVKVPNVAYSKYQTSKLGNKFLALYSMKE